MKVSVKLHFIDSFDALVANKQFFLRSSVTGRRREILQTGHEIFALSELSLRLPSLFLPCVSVCISIRVQSYLSCRPLPYITSVRTTVSVSVSVSDSDSDSDSNSDFRLPSSVFLLRIPNYVFVSVPVSLSTSV